MLSNNWRKCVAKSSVLIVQKAAGPVIWLCSCYFLVESENPLLIVEYPNSFQDVACISTQCLPTSPWKNDAIADMITQSWMRCWLKVEGMGRIPKVQGELHARALNFVQVCWLKLSAVWSYNEVMNLEEVKFFFEVALTQINEGVITPKMELNWISGWRDGSESCLYSR